MTGAEIRALRLQAGLSQRKLGRLLDQTGSDGAATAFVVRLEKRGIRPGERDDWLRRRLALLDGYGPINMENAK